MWANRGGKQAGQRQGRGRAERGSNRCDQADLGHAQSISTATTARPEESWDPVLEGPRWRRGPQGVKTEPKIYSEPGDWQPDHRSQAFILSISMH